VVKVSVPPATEPVTLQEAALHCRVDTNAGPVVACATTSGSAIVTPVDMTGIFAGMSVAGAGIQTGTVVQTVGVSTITLSKTATATSAAEFLTFGVIGGTAAEDDLLSALIVAAREYCESYQGRSYITQTLEMTLDGWPDLPMHVPRPPLASVVSIKYYGTDNTEYTLDAANYFVDIAHEPGRICLSSNGVLPSTALRELSSVKITYTAGGATVAKKVKQAILLLVGHWYANREAAGKVTDEIKFAVHALLSQERMWPI
jgi:uncharacterized phiE125 gp8 family phage protein